MEAGKDKKVDSPEQVRPSATTMNLRRLLGCANPEAGKPTHREEYKSHRKKHIHHRPRWLNQWPVPTPVESTSFLIEMAMHVGGVCRWR